ncbi:Protein argonaute-3 [Sergentomyia squamirostris]
MSTGRGRKLELLMGLSSESSRSAESGILSSERPLTSDRKTGDSSERNVSRDSGEDSLAGSSSLGRGRRYMMAMAKESEKKKLSPTAAITPDDSMAETGFTRGTGRGVSTRLAVEAARQYDPKDRGSVEAVTERMKGVTVTEPLRETATKEPLLYRGKAGVITNTACNYLALQWKTTDRIFEYSVNFNPPIDGINLRVKIIHQIEAEIGKIFVFSGFNIYLPRKLDKMTVCKTELSTSTTKETVTVTIKFIKEKPDEELSPFLNQLFNRIMRELKYVRYKRKQFDPTKAKFVPQHKLEIWPGYVTSVDTFEGGLMLNMDVSHRRLSSMTVRELMSDIHNKYPNDFHKQVKAALIGKVVLTRYNYETYTVHEVDFTLSPKDKFLRNGQEIDYVEYYRRSYNITVKDLNQPLLINFKEVRVSGSAKKEERTTCLIPELCYLTGLTDSQLNNMTLKRDLATFTNVTPQHRVEGLRKFVENVQESPAANQILASWGLQLGADALNIEARELGVEMVNFDGHRASAGVEADFTRDATSKRVLHAVPITDWAIVYSERNRNEATIFLTQVTRNANVIGMNVKNPTHIALRNDNTGEFVRRITEAISTNPEFKIIVAIFPTQRGELYASVKKVCCYQLPIPSQVVMAKTLAGSNESKTRSIVMKILLQMNCKVGGSLWSVNIPMAGTMICGVDAYHDPSHKQPSVTAFVASTNKNFTKWFSSAIIQNIREEVSRSLGMALKDALAVYRETNGSLPERIVMFRDGVGDGQLPLCENFEVPQLLSTASEMYPEGEQPKLTYVVTQKRINTRFFRKEGSSFKNPVPGTVVDHTVTRRYMKDFFLISQHVRHGTVTPSHYVIVFDSANLTPDIVQKLAYKLTFMYYNWPGTIRVPACCQYAHKLAYLIGEHVKKEPSKKLQDKLFYL